MEIQVRENFSETVLTALKKKEISKRWLYLQLGMAAQTFELRIKQNDWRLGEIIKITSLLDLK